MEDLEVPSYKGNDTVQRLIRVDTSQMGGGIQTNLAPVKPLLDAAGPANELPDQLRLG